MRPLLTSYLAFMALAAMTSSKASESSASGRTWVSGEEFERDCTASAAERLAPLEASVARLPKNGRLNRVDFSAQWAEADSPVVIRIERGECDGETAITASPMGNADRLDQLDAMIAIVERLLSAAHALEAKYLFEDANDVVVDSSLNGDIITMWSSRRTPRFPEGAWLELGPETAKIFWVEQADAKLREGMLQTMAAHRELRGGRLLKWRQRDIPSD
ncbi:MAG: hypothetical protein ACOY37_06740 [Pseudomonadota bacterium]